ncbi:MAG: hypothetical protein Q9169_000574 [Polycauliona sp. 2 TL-2023]
MGNSTAAVGSNDLEQQIKDAEEQVKTTRCCQRILKAGLASLNAADKSDDIHSNITILELEKEELSIRLKGFRTGKILPVTAEEKKTADQQLQHWAGEAASRRRMFMELWAMVKEFLPEGQSKDQLWVGITDVQRFPRGHY